MLSSLNLAAGWNIAIVFSVSGQYVDERGSSDGISNLEDRKVLGHLRSQSDYIVTSGLTARQEQYRGSKYAPIVIFTRHLKSVLTVPAVATPSSHPTIVFTEDAEVEGVPLPNLPSADIRPLLAGVAPLAQVEVGLGVSPRMRLLYEGGLNTAQELVDGSSPLRIIATIADHSPADIHESASIVVKSFGLGLADFALSYVQGAKNLYLIFTRS